MCQSLALQFRDPDSGVCPLDSAGHPFALQFRENQEAASQNLLPSVGHRTARRSKRGRRIRKWLRLVAACRTRTQGRRGRPVFCGLRGCDIPLLLLPAEQKKRLSDAHLSVHRLFPREIHDMARQHQVESNQGLRVDSCGCRDFADGSFRHGEMRGSPDLDIPWPSCRPEHSHDGGGRPA